MLVWNQTKNTFHFYGREIAEAEYSRIKAMVRSRPTAPEGYAYRLTPSLEWELYEQPVYEAEATIQDYQAALAEFGVSL